MAVSKTNRVRIEAYGPIDGWPPKFTGTMTLDEANSITKHYTHVAISRLDAVSKDAIDAALKE